MKIEKDVRIPMRDGVHLAADIYRPGAEQGAGAAGAEPLRQGAAGARADHAAAGAAEALWDGGIEAGDIRAVVEHGYAHVIADVRGTGGSEGELVGNYDLGGHGEGKDVYDLVEWIARQPWCDGNVGMIGISYFATVQVMGAAEAPPHLKAIFVNGGHFDLYELCYHGGIMWLMPRASREGRGGDSGVAVRKVSNKSKRVYSPEEYQARIRARLADPDIAHWPNMVHVLNYPETHELWMDFILNPHDGPFWQEGQAIGNAHKVKVPAYFQVKWGAAGPSTAPSTASRRCKASSVSTCSRCRPCRSGRSTEVARGDVPLVRPLAQGHRHRIMNEDGPIRVFVEGARRWRTEKEWPLKRGMDEILPAAAPPLAAAPEPLGPEDAPPDGFYQAPFTVTGDVQSVKWTTAPLIADTEITGPAALYVHAAIDTDDTNLIAKLYDVDPQGNRRW